MSGPLFFDPLPVPTRLVGGEGVSTYASRHATRNFSNVKDIERAVREQGYPLSNARSAPERLALWRQLGNLQEQAFSEPQVVAGNWVIDRRLCDRCMPHLEDGMGRLPWVGWVCLKHKRWTKGDEQTDLARFGEALVAERHWRGRLAPRGVVVDSPLLLLAEESATVGISKAVLEERAERVRHPSPGLLVYPETVRLARLLSRRSFLDAVFGDAPSPWKRALVEREVRSIFLTLWMLRTGVPSPGSGTSFIPFRTAFGTRIGSGTLQRIAVMSFATGQALRSLSALKSSRLTRWCRYRRRRAPTISGSSWRSTRHRV